MLVTHIFALVSILAYLVASFAYFSSIKSPKKENSRGFAFYSLLSGFLFQSLFLILSFFSPSATNLILLSPTSLSLITTGAVSAYLLLGKGVPLFGLVVSLIAFLLSSFAAGLFHLEPTSSLVAAAELTTVLWLHVALALVANILFLLSFVVSVGVLIKDSALKGKRGLRLAKLLPPLLLLERLNFQFVRTGFVFMGFAVLLGVLSLQRLPEVAVLDIRFLLSFFTMAIYGILLQRIISTGFRGRRSAFLSIVGFSSVVFSLVVSSPLGGGFHA